MESVGDEDELLNEDLDVGDNYSVDVKPEPTFSFKRPRNTGPRNRCPYGCNKDLATRTIDYHRTNGCRMGGEEPLGDTTKKRNFTCGVCCADFVTRAGFFLHLKNEHDVNPNIHHLMFRSRALFERFMRWTEMIGGAHFRFKSGSKRRASGKGIFMACNRSGIVSNGHEKRTGPYRAGFTCTAYIHGTEHANGAVDVEVCVDHYGHDARMRLPNVIKQIIAKKQLLDEPPQDILAYLKRHFAPFYNDNIYAQRACLVDLDELRTLQISATKKWATTGVPNDCEVWEEELLDKVGIVREGCPRLRKPGDPTTEELAVLHRWPRACIFIPKVKHDSGFLGSRRTFSHSEDVNDYLVEEDSKPFVENKGIGRIDDGSHRVRSRSNPESYRHSHQMNRQHLISNFHNEIQFIERVAQCDLPYIPDSSLMSCLTQLRSIRSELSACLEDKNGDNGPESSQNHEDQIDVKGNFSEIVMMAEGEVHNELIKHDEFAPENFSDDESIASSSGCIEYNKTFWS